MKKKVVVLILVFIMLGLLCGMRMLHNNFQLGRDLYFAVCDMSVQSALLGDSISFLKTEFTKADKDEVCRHRHSFDFAIADVRSSFGYDNMPMLDDVRIELIDCFEELYCQTRSDEGLKEFFIEEPDKVDGMQNLLKIMEDTFVDFIDMYNRIPRWKQYFVSWENERKILNEKISNSMPD